MANSETDGPDLGRRIAAVGALATGVLTVVVLLAGLRGDLWRVIAAPVVVLVIVAAGWSALTTKGAPRLLWAGLSLLGVVGLIVLTLTGERHGLVLVVSVALAAASIGMSRYARRHDRRTLQAELPSGTPVGPAQRAALIMNPKSGGGKVERFNLEEEARQRGIEPIVLSRGDDLLKLAEDAIARGVDVIGMAGGDGSQALVASVAMKADIPLVCIPAGTRNHFALDLGLDRDDVLGALDSFGEAVERCVDLAVVGDRVFVNNVSLGVYAKVVESEEYRDAKRETFTTMLPDLVGPDAKPFDLRFKTPDGTERSDAQIILVSNNPYTMSPFAGAGTRARLDGGVLGIGAAKVEGPGEAAAMVAAQASGRLDRFKGWSEWSAPTFIVESGEQIEAGVDGESLVFDSPLEFRTMPGAIRIRIPLHAPGRSPAALASPSIWSTAASLWRIATTSSS